MDGRKTCLHRATVAAGGRMMPFAGWELPVRFSGTVAEHLAVRRHAGLFDVSHMGQVEVRGGGALELLQRLTTNDLSRVEPGQLQYTVLTTPAGTCVDDLVVARIDADEFLLTVNAANEDKDFHWIREHAGGGATVVNRSADFGLIALQGPAAADRLAAVTPAPVAALRPFRFLRGDVAGVSCLISRTGYTGEDGFEICTPWDGAEPVWNRLLEAGDGDAPVPIGLGARDTLRLEAKLLLYGQDMDETTTPWEAGLGRFIRFDTGDFLGRAVLLRQSEEGPDRRLAGFEMVDAGIARHGYRVVRNGAEIGRVTSGGPAPFLRRNIGLAYLPSAVAAPGTEIDVEIRDAARRARVVQGPFYRRSTARASKE